MSWTLGDCLLENYDEKDVSPSTFRLRGGKNWVPVAFPGSGRPSLPPSSLLPRLKKSSLAPNWALQEMTGGWQGLKKTPKKIQQIPFSPLRYGTRDMLGRI